MLIRRVLKENGHGGGSTLVYVVVSVGIILFLILLLGCFWWRRREHKLHQLSHVPSPVVNVPAPTFSNAPYHQLHPQFDSGAPSSNPVSIFSSLKPLETDTKQHTQPSKAYDLSQEEEPIDDAASRILHEFQTDETILKWFTSYNNLHFTRVVSKGAFGEVWLAQLEDQQVAVKRMLSERKNDEKEIECFAAEIKLMASFSHPKIVQFLGLSWNNVQDLCAVTEYMPRGDLFDYLKKKQNQIRWHNSKLYLAEDISSALQYLHSLQPKVIHRDLKSKNVLLDENLRAKLSDFGISRERQLEETMTAGVGTVYWIAPEVLLGKKYTEKADIFSFGVVMSELDTHRLPYSDHKDGAGRRVTPVKIARAVAQIGLRPTFSRTCPDQVRAIANRCLDADPDMRPHAFELVKSFQELQSQ